MVKMKEDKMEERRIKRVKKGGSLETVEKKRGRMLLLLTLQIISAPDLCIRGLVT